MEKTEKYVHGYSKREAGRLVDQAESIRNLLHHDTTYLAGSKVLEAGCGVGAQTVSLAKSSPDAEIISIDISLDSLKKAENLIRDEGLLNVKFQEADIFNLPFVDEYFDHIFVCYVLEHMENPQKALLELHRVLKKGGSITVIEGDHGSCYFYPSTNESVKAWNCLIKVQSSLKGNSLIGRELFPLLSQTSFSDIIVSPRMVYIDQSKPDLMNSFVKDTIIPMVEGIENQALKNGYIDNSTWKKGIDDLCNIVKSVSGTFCYTFFKAVAKKYR